jgi:hypothetical protein
MVTGSDLYTCELTFSQEVYMFIYCAMKPETIINMAQIQKKDFPQFKNNPNICMLSVTTCKSKKLLRY